ncbi:MAG: hypothetical protein HOQ24_10915, partial [Mycobacteriaceae bacterium]|nr:hypothetical protein [Mycobacteriaceae bacterium]
AALALRPTAGRLLAVGGADGLSLWALGRDGATPGRRPLPPQPPGLRVRALSWSQSGDQLAAATDRGLMEWTVAADGRATPRPTSGASRDVRSVTWSGPVLITAAGRDVTVADRSGTALPDRTLTLGDDDGDIESVVADPAAATLALITSRRRVLLVDTAGPAPTPIGRVLTGGQATAAAFDSTGATLVVGHEDGTVQPFGVAALRRADMSAAPGRPWTSPGSVASIGFTDSDRSMAVVHEDGTVRRWSLPGPVTAPADSEYTGFRADAEGTVAGVRKRGTPGRDDELHLFDLSDGARESAAPLTIGPDGPTREPMTVSGDGTVAATATRSGEIRLWPIGLRPGFAPRSPVTLPLNGTGAIALTHDGKLLAAAASGDRRIVLVDLSAGAGTPTVIDAGGRVASVEFGASGALLAAGVGDGVRMWDVAAGRPPAPVTDIAGLAGSPGTITLIRLSPDGSTLAAGGSDGTVHLVDVTRPGRAARLSSVRVPLGPIQSITFNRKATRLVIGADVRLTVVDIKDRRRPSTYAVLGAGQTAGYLVDASYGPHETSLTAAGTRGSLHTWRTDAESVADRLCADSLSAVTAQEWRIYLPDTRYRNPCS